MCERERERKRERERDKERERENGGESEREKGGESLSLCCSALNRHYNTMVVQ